MIGGLAELVAGALSLRGAGSGTTPACSRSLGAVASVSCGYLLQARMGELLVQARRKNQPPTRRSQVFAALTLFELKVPVRSHSFQFDGTCDM